jgi:hypothetical protein
MFVKGQGSFRSSPAVNIVPPSSAALKSASTVLGELVKKDDVTCSCMLIPGKLRRLKNHLRPVNVSSP